MSLFSQFKMSTNKLPIAYATILILFFILSLARFVNNLHGIVDLGSSEYKNVQDSQINGLDYPVIFTDEEITLPKNISTISSFSSLWSPNRKVTSNLPQKLNNRQLRFTQVGEYYLIVNGEYIIRVLALNKSAPASENLRYLNNFASANFIATQADDFAFNSDPEKYLNNFATRVAPGQLLCGPTLDFLSRIITNKLKLPTRSVEFTGVNVNDGQIEYSTHNTIEAFAPDINKWVNLDPNNALLVKNSSALDITRMFRSVTKGETRRISHSEFNSMKLEFDRSVRAFDAKNIELPFNSPFNPANIGDRMVHENLENLAILYLGGPTYWRDRPLINPGPYGDFDMYFTAAHSEEFLNDAAVKWESNWDLSVSKIGLENMDKFLEYAYAPFIQRIK